MLRRFIGNPRLAAAVARSTVVCSARSIAVYSESDPILLNNQTARNFKSNLWVEETDKYWTDKLTPVKVGEKPTKVRIQRRFELFNLDQLQNAPARLRDQSPGAHTSTRTQKTYGDLMQKKLEEHCVLNNYTSKWWVTPGEARKNSWLVKERQRPFVSQFKAEAGLFNAEQFEKPEAINGQTFSASSRKPFGHEMHDKLSQFVKTRQFQSGLFFSERQASELGLAKRSDAIGVQLEVGAAEALMLYNADQLVNWTHVLDELQRFPVQEPTFLMSGRVLIPEFKAAVDGKEKHETNYWVSKRDIEARGWQLRADAKGAAVPPKYRGFKMYNVYELHDPAHAFKIVCSSESAH